MNPYCIGKQDSFKKPALAEYKPIKTTQLRIAAERFYVLLEDGWPRVGHSI